MPDMPPADVIRPECGTFAGLKAHRGDLCVICQAFADSERVEAERRRATPSLASIRAAEFYKAALREMVDDQDPTVRHLRRVS